MSFDYSLRKSIINLSSFLEYFSRIIFSFWIYSSRFLMLSFKLLIYKSRPPLIAKESPLMIGIGTNELIPPIEAAYYPFLRLASYDSRSFYVYVKILVWDFILFWLFLIFQILSCTVFYWSSYSFSIIDIFSSVD